jgi:glycosyltransferase involved in cell wall biosynthesis
MNFFGYYVLNLQPTILSYIGGVYPAPDWLQADALIEHVPWWHGDLFSMVRRKLSQIRHERSGVPHSLMVHAPDEEVRRKQFKVKGGFISQNIYIDADTFKPMDCEKKYQAIYVAVLHKYKRHFLAGKIQNMLCITGGSFDTEKYKQQMPHAVFANRRFSKTELALALNSASCSLALSKVEGGMLVSFESLLCGIPVVSTPSKGGRDLFFNSYNCLIAEPNAQSVADAVCHFQAHRPDPHQIRSQALQDLEPHRLRFCQYVSQLAISLGGAEIDPKDRYQRYFSSAGGLTNHFIWVDKFEIPSEVERVRTRSFIG